MFVVSVSMRVLMRVTTVHFFAETELRAHNQSQCLWWLNANAVWLLMIDYDSKRTVCRIDACSTLGVQRNIDLRFAKISPHAQPWHDEQQWHSFAIARCFVHVVCSTLPIASFMLFVQLCSVFGSYKADIPVKCIWALGAARSQNQGWTLEQRRGQNQSWASPRGDECWQLNRLRLEQLLVYEMWISNVVS